MATFISVTVIPLLLLLCKCGAAGMAGAFTDMPFDTKEHLISYHTEGQGEDRVRNTTSSWRVQNIGDFPLFISICTPLFYKEVELPVKWHKSFFSSLLNYHIWADYKNSDRRFAIRGMSTPCLLITIQLLLLTVEKSNHVANPLTQSVSICINQY